MGSDKIISINPATLEINGEVELTPAEDVNLIVEKARSVFPLWRDTPMSVRSLIIKKVQELLLDRGMEFAELITCEMGRPVVESFSLEIAASVDIAGYYAENAGKFLNNRKVPLHHLRFKRRERISRFEPLGVFGVISPWNWPLLIPLSSIIPALLAGNCVVFKHSDQTPLISERIYALFRDAGIPEGVFQIIQGGADQGRALVGSSVEKIFFTGSTDVGRKIYKQASDSLKKCVLEMGGSDPAIVCKDADIEYTSSGIVWGAFSNCGQNCNGMERVFVHSSVLSKFVELLLSKTKELRIGSGLDYDTDLGPLSSKKQLDKMNRILFESVMAGCTVLTGGKRVEGSIGYFFEPTIIMRDKSLYTQKDDEIFGPIIYVTEVDSDEEAVELANRSSFGLSSSIWTKNPKHGMKLARYIEAGTVMINDVIVSFGMAEAGWTGIKKSGVGWVHGEKGLDEMVNIKYINRDPQASMQKIWWFPYTEKMLKTMKAGIIFLFSGKLRSVLVNIPIVLKNLTGQLLLNRKRSDKL